MLVAFELKKTLKELYEQVDQEELGWWLAFLKYKQELEDKQRELNKARRGRRGQT